MEENKGIQKICVFSGSKSGKNPNFEIKTKAFAEAMIKHEPKLSLVYGGGTVGLMGVMANTIHNNGGEVIGIIPKSLAPREVSGTGIGTQIVVSSMHERKLKMYQSCDAFVALPGGFGTFEELLEVVTWMQLGIHRKPIGVLDVDNFYFGFRELVKNAVEEGFIKREVAEEGIIYESDPDKLLSRLLEHRPPTSEICWLKEDQI